MKKLILLIGIMFLISAAIACAETITYKTGIYEVSNQGNYDLLYINNGDLWEEDGELREPVAMQNFNVSSDKAIKSITLKSRNKPEEFELNIPQIGYTNNDVYANKDRECFENFRDAYTVVWAHTYEKTAYVMIEVHPLEVTDCEKGIFTLYQEMEMEVEYYEENKIKSVENTGLVSGQSATLTFNLENRNPDSKIVVRDDWGNELASSDVDSDTEEITITVPEDTANLYLPIEYYEGDEIVDRAVITQDLNWGKMDFRVLVSDDPAVFPLVVQIDSTKQESIKINLLIKSTDRDLEEMSTMNKEITAEPGSTLHYINFKVTEEEKVNDISIEAESNGITEYAEHNSIVRFTKDEVRGGLPPPPGQEIAEELIKGISNPEKYEAEHKTSGSSIMTILIIVIAAILMLGLGFVVFKYMKKDKEY